MNGFEGFTKGELKLLKSLKTPKKIQDFLETLKINFELNGDTCMSPKMVLETGTAHCAEGAILAASAFRLQRQKPMLVDLEVNKHDDAHVLTVFKQYGYWGAITKTNHAVLRYREPVYKTIRELIMSYFHEYFTDDGKKNMRSFSMPVDLSRFDKLGWMTSKEDIWYIPDYLEKTPHKLIVTKAQIANFRKADDIEIKAGKLIEWRNNGEKNKY